MLPADILCEDNISTHIATVEDYPLTEPELALRRVWNSLPPEQAVYFTLLDAYTVEDPFYIALRSTVEKKVYGRGLERVGDLIALRPDEVAARTDLTPAELRTLTSVLSKMGLSFGSDVTAWRNYRATVPAEFRLHKPWGIRLPKDTRSPLEI